MRPRRSCRERQQINYADLDNPLRGFLARLELYRDKYNKYIAFCSTSAIPPIVVPSFSPHSETTSRLLHETIDTSNRSYTAFRRFFTRDELEDLFDTDQYLWIHKRQMYYEEKRTQHHVLTRDEMAEYADLCEFEQAQDPDADDYDDDDDDDDKSDAEDEERISHTSASVSILSSSSRRPSCSGDIADDQVAARGHKHTTRNDDEDSDDDEDEDEFDPEELEEEYKDLMGLNKKEEDAESVGTDYSFIVPDDDYFTMSEDDEYRQEDDDESSSGAESYKDDEDGGHQPSRLLQNPAQSLSGKKRTARSRNTSSRAPSQKRRKR